MELFLKAESPAFGDLETLNAQLTESMVYNILYILGFKYSHPTYLLYTGSTR